MLTPQNRRHPLGLGLVICFILAATPRLAAQVTETPQTIAPGKFFVRMDAVSVGVNRDNSGPNTYTALGVASTVVSTGITRDLDVQAAMQLFLRQTYQYGGSRTSHSGLGD